MVKIIGSLVAVLLVVVLGLWWTLREGESELELNDIQVDTITSGESEELELVEDDLDAVSAGRNELSDDEQVVAEREVATLSAITPYVGSGMATRSFDGKVYRHTVEADLADPAEGKFYEGWLVKKKPSLVFISTGKLTDEGDGYSLLFTASSDFPGYDEVVITEETSADGLDNKPEAHVLEGVF